MSSTISPDRYVAPSPSNNWADGFFRTMAGVAGDFIGKATGIGAIGSGLSAIGNLDASNQTHLLKVQQELQEKNFFFSTASAIQSSEHQTRMAIVREFKS